MTATYYLILKKHIKAGGESVADARQPTYNPSVFLKRVPNLKNLLEEAKKDKSKEKLAVPDAKTSQIQVAKIAQSPSLNFNASSSPGILSPSIRGSSLPPQNPASKNNGKPRESKRRIAEGLGDFQRYSERKKTQR